MASSTFSYVQEWNQFLAAKGWWHSFELPDGRRIDGMNPLEGQKLRLSQFPIPNDLCGKRVLDIGAWDGWFTFEMEKRGADVLAIDCWDNPRFHQMRSMLNSRAEYRVMDVYELTPESVGRFDIVLFMGVLYHLKHPLLALERVCALATDVAYVESFALREKHRPGDNVERRPVMEFYETDEFGGQTDNWVAPSLPCLMAMCRTAGFARVEHRATLEHGASLLCHRKWEPPARAASAGPELLDAFHHMNYGINFYSRYDEYISAWFRHDGAEPSLDDVKPEVGGFGVRPIRVSKVAADRCQANFKLPPGLAPGWHEVRLRLGGSAAGNARNIAVDIPVVAAPVAITGLCDGSTWEPGVVRLSSENGALAAWVSGLPVNADRNNVRLYINGVRLTVTWVEPPSNAEGRQVNAEVPGEMPRGDAQLTAAVGDSNSAPVTVRLIG